jgi:hypothetical protein
LSLLFHLSALPLVSARSFICLASCLCSFIYLPWLLFLCFYFISLARWFLCFHLSGKSLSRLYHLSARPLSMYALSFIWQGYCLAISFSLYARLLSQLFHLFSRPLVSALSFISCLSLIFSLAGTLLSLVYHLSVSSMVKVVLVFPLSARFIVSVVLFVC